MNLFNFTNNIDSFDTSFSSKEIAIIKEFHSSINSHRVDNKIIGSGGSDFFYLPRRKFEAFHVVAQIFKGFGIFLEIAVPTMLNGLDKENQSLVAKGIYKWGTKFNLELEYNNSETYMHPYKLSGIRNSTSGKSFCKFYVQDKINNNI